MKAVLQANVDSVIDIKSGDCRVSLSDENISGSIPLNFAPYGKTLTIMKINVDDKIKKRFCSLGLLVGVKVMSFSQEGDSVIIKIKDTKLALNRALAMKIYVA